MSPKRILNVGLSVIYLSVQNFFRKNLFQSLGLKGSYMYIEEALTGSFSA